MVAPQPRDPERDSAEARAGELFLHGALQRVFAADPEARERRIRSVVAELGDDVAARAARRRPLVRRFPRLSTAAALTLATVGFWLVFGTRPANASVALDAAIASAAVPVDREYAVTLQAGRDFERRRAGRLYVRGDRSFALRCESNESGLWFGSNGHDAWLVPGIEEVPVIVARDWVPLEAALEDAGFTFPLLQISGVLETLRDSYAITVLEGDPADRNRPLALRGTLAVESKLLPHEIELHIEAHSQVVRSLTLDWRESRTILRRHPRRIRFELLGEFDAPLDWYEHAGHHDPDRRVTQF